MDLRLMYKSCKNFSISENDQNEEFYLFSLYLPSIPPSIRHPLPMTNLGVIAPLQSAVDRK